MHEETLKPTWQGQTHETDIAKKKETINSLAP